MNGLENIPYDEATQIGLMGQPGHVRWSDSRVIWHERRGDHAAVLAATDSYDSRYRYLYLLLTSLSDEWHPAHQASPAQWVPYENGNSTGVFMQLIQCPVDSSELARIRTGSCESEAPISDGFVCIVIWDVDRSAVGPLEFLEVKVANEWQRCVTHSLPASAAQFGDAYLKRSNVEAHYWASEALRSADSSEDLLTMVMSIVKRAHLPEDEAALGAIGAGALEDMMSDWLLERLVDYLPFDERLKYSLSSVRMEFEPDALQRRLNTMLAAG
ncbi:MAG TPA: hypothetical protein VN476_15450 [Pyrinomonadaceae bacterium]|nr:hypothetical protein [Pyrinomonadaceae bacterium]